MQAALLMGLIALASASPLVSAAAESAVAPPMLPSTVDAASTAPGTIRDLDTVVVTGVQPGPGMWKVSRGGHVMWVLGVVSPLPKAMTWQSAEVEALIARAGQVLQQPLWSVHSDVGWFKGLTLLPAALRARRNPDDAELEDVLPAELYARWQVQKDKYLGWEWGIERWRPMFAAEKLDRKAMDRLGLGDGMVDEVVAAAAKRAGLTPTVVQVKTTIEDPRELLKAFSRESFDDTMCLEHAVSRLEHELPTLAARANAWATGDLATLKRLPHDDSRKACLRSLLHSDMSRSLGYEDIPLQIEKTWLDAARQALADHAVSFALLSMDDILGRDGYLTKLQAEGYLVEAPSLDGGQAVDPVSAAPAASSPDAAAHN